ncbi:MAG: hypothetical protein GXP62_14480 [Oligoflexia bacterium]|nr:hypothetical protein [Oligoflexia bacterium]
MSTPMKLTDLADRCARTRLQGVQRLRQAGGPVALLLPLLADDAPYLFAHAGRGFLAELRADALVAIEDLYRLAGRQPDFGSVQMRRAMAEDQARSMSQALLDAMPPGPRIELLARVDQSLAERVQPQPFERDACRAYRVLQTLGRVPYQTQTVDPLTLLTPLQAQVNQTQVQTERPHPHLRFDGAQGPVGWVYRQGSRWVQDFSEAPETGRIRRMLNSFMRAESGQLPRVVGAAEGAPRSNPDGSLITDGVVSRDTADPADYLASLAAFCDGLLACELVR